MTGMSKKDIIRDALLRRPTERVGVFEHFWPETISKWQAEGHLKKDELPEEHFDLDMNIWWTFNLVADLDAQETIIEEGDQTKVIRNGNGAILKYWKHKSGTPEHLDFEVRDRRAWEEKIRPLVTDKSLYPRRIQSGEGHTYASRRQRAADRNQFFCCSGVNVFEAIHPVCGHAHMLMGMALDPEWVRDMAVVYADMIIDLMEMTFSRDGKPDGIWFYEDMGFKHRPFMSPDMYRDLIWPSHKKTINYAHDNGLPVIMHSCGYIEPFIPSLIEAELDCLQAIEVKAGMDLLHLKKCYGDKITLCGGIDIRVLESNDKSEIESYLKNVIPAAIENGGYIVHTDHSIPDTVHYQTYMHFLNRINEIGVD